MKIAQINIGNTFDSPFGRMDNGKGFGDLVSTFLSNSVVLAGFTLFILILLGGIGIMAGAGKSDPQAAARGKQIVTSAIIGFIVVFSAYWIIQIVENITGFAILSPAL